MQHLCDDSSDEEPPKKKVKLDPPQLLSKKKKSARKRPTTGPKKQKPVYPKNLAKKIHFHRPTTLKRTPKSDINPRSSKLLKGQGTTNAEVHPENKTVQVLES